MTIRRNATAARITSHPNLTSVTSEPSISALVNRQLASLDRQYSYEHTVQLGRYRLEDQVPADQAAAKKLDDDIAAENKKSVRFHHFDPREIWKEEKRARTWGAQFKRWKSQLGPSMPWATIKMMLADWLYLAALGIGMALLSMAIDQMIEYMQTCKYPTKFFVSKRKHFAVQMLLMTMAGRAGTSGYDYLYTYLCWLGYTELLVICSAMFVHYVAPQAIGSGIPEMKTILRGVILKDYLTFRTLISKIVGLTLSLGSGIPIGKMGPMVHISAIVANLLSNLAANFEGAYGNESRKAEMLAAGCAVGVACTFSAPVEIIGEVIL
uniref:Chloride channel protein 2 n=1 Tax=Panagrolaimus davidi TaxID=227884 RepID=A0A914QUE4_9BILA